MNEEEAKVPDVQGHWRSIEIFVFSNGQQYSPPRKYHLRAEELNLWDDTLNLLAQSHYGLQSPIINLYTTDGQLVEGPLELKDGLAYVAVTLPDTFIDAGYQKYLIRASRSWEKRQARMKIPECVPEELCCLCPEKEWCCDLRTCCICPEKEDEGSPESLLCATGHPELRPVGGHFMSSAPSKPAAADDYRPRTDKIASTLSGEHAFKPGEYGVSRAEFGYSPVESLAKPDEYEARLVEYGANSSEHALRLNENGSRLGEFKTRPDEFRTRPDEYGAKLNENEMRPGNYEAYPGDHAAKLSKNGVSTGEFGPRLDETVPIVSKNVVKTSEYVASLTENGPRLRKDGARLKEYGTRPGENAVIPVEYKTTPSLNGAKPSEYGVKPGKHETTTSINGARTSVNVARPGEYEARPNKQGARPSEYKTKRSINGENPNEYEFRPGEYETRPTVNGAKSSEYKARPGENGAKPSEYKARLGEYETKPTVNGAKPGEYETRPSVNGTKPDEYRATSGEYADRSAEQRTQLNEYRPRSAKGGAWSDEDGVIATVHEARPDNDEPWSHEIESKKETYEIGLRDSERSLDDNVDEPDKDTVDKDAGVKYKFQKQSSTLSPIGESKLEKKGEYGVAEGDQRDEQIDPKCRESGNGGRGGERKVSGGEKSGRKNTVNGISEPRTIQIENARISSKLKPAGTENKRRPNQQRGEIEQTRRLSGRAGAEIEQSGRMGELTRDFEHGGRVSAQKGRETNPAGGAGVNAARLSEHRNKQSGHLGRLDGRESRAGDHEVRAGDLKLRSSDHDAGLVNPGSRVADPDAGAAVSGSRISPRDRMSSKARTSNLGQSTLGTPVTRVDETAVKLDELVIKNREVYPGARQSSIGGTGAAGALHISAAQQHARRSSLSAGRTSTEKRRLSMGQNSSLLRKPTTISSVIRKSEDKQPIKINREILSKRTTCKASAIPVPAFNDARQSKTLPKDPYKHSTPPTPQPPTISMTNLVNLPTNKAALENFIDVKEIIVVSTHSFRDSESEIRSMGLDSVKKVLDVINYSPKETQTELIYVGNRKASVTVNEGVQTNTEAVEQCGQEVSASSKAKVNSCTCMCALCSKRHHRLATVDPDENIISIQNKGDVINLKLNIEVRNIVKSVYSSQKNCLRSQSLTKISRSEIESQIYIDDGIFVRRKSSLQLNNQYFRGYGFEGSPKVMVVQCAGCGRLNYPPRCELPLCCDNNKKYFVLLANSVNEDMDDCCNLNPPCRPCDLKKSPLKKTSSGVPIKQTLSEMTLDTITTVTVSGVPLQRRGMVKKTDTACQTEEPQCECMMTKRKVSISDNSGTKSDFQKETSSSICVTTQVNNLKAKQSCRKLCPQKYEHEDSQVCSEFCPPVMLCQKVQSECSQVSSQGCPQVQSEGCKQTSPHVQSQECIPVSPTCSPCNPQLPCIQVQTQVCPQVPQVSDAQTQTQWGSIVLQARLHPDGRYSFHLPPLNVLNSYSF